MTQNKQFNDLSIMRLATIFICLFITLNFECTVRAQETKAPVSQCVLSEANARWIQKALNGWGQVSRDFLRINSQPLPWIVLFNDTCTWHINPEVGMLSGSATPVDTSLRFAGKSIATYVLSNNGTVNLPNGNNLPTTIMAAAFPYDDGKKSFYALALLDLWHKDPQASKDPILDDRILSATLHEMIHTRQMADLSYQISILRKKYTLPSSFDDNVIEDRFKKVPEFKKAFEAELDLLYQAIAEKRQSQRRKLVADALALVKKRRATFFQGDNEMYGKLETLFLNMEGVGEWVRFKFHQAEPKWKRNDAEIIKFLRGREDDWSQDEGLALFLLLEKLVPGWQKKVISQQMTSPFKLLEEAVKTPSVRKKKS